MDFVESHPVPGRLVEDVRAALRGEEGGWPAELPADEIAALVAHGVGPLLFSVTNHASLRDEAIRAAALEAIRADDLRDALGALRGMDVLVIKGSALAYQIYPAPELRPRADTDLLIARSALEAVRERLVSAGFAEMSGSGDEHGMRQTLFTRRDARGVSHSYDVHWDVTNASAFASALRFESVWQRSVTLPGIGEHVRGLALPDALLLACIHRVAHHYDSERLIWLADIALLRDRMSAEEHQRFWRAASAARVVAVCARSIALADEWWSRRPTHSAREFLSPAELKQSEPSSVFLDRDVLYGQVLLANLRGLPWRLRVERLWQLAFPPAEFMRGGAKGNAAPLIWLYARRGISSVRRLFTRAASPHL